MKKLLLIVSMFIISLFTLTSCKNTDKELVDWTEEKYEAVVELPEDIKKEMKGKLRVTTSPDYAPYTFLDMKAEGLKRFQGADIFLANYLAQSLGLELEIVESNFDGLTIQLDNNRADLILAGMTYTEERAKNYDITDYYYANGDGGQVLLVLKDQYDNLNSKDAMNQNHITIGAQAGSVQFQLAEEQLEAASVKPFSKIDDGLNRLKHGNFQALALSGINAKTAIKKDSSLKIIDSFVLVEDNPSGTMGLLKKGSDLTTYINEALEKLDAKAYENWLNASIDYSVAISVDVNTNFFKRFGLVISEYGTEFLKGTGITLALSAVTVIFGTIIAVGLSVIRRSKYVAVRSVGNAYVEFVRGIPLLLLLWLLYMISPASWPTYVSVTIALFLNSGAYVAEIIRAGVAGVDKGQYEAGRTLGLSKFQTMRKIILPQAVKKILPALGNEFVSLIKETSLASVFFIGDLMTVKNNITAITYLSIEPFIVVGIIYFVLTYGTTKLIKLVEKKLEA